MTRIFRAALETANFTFEAYGETEREAFTAMRHGWNVHRKQYDADDTWDDVEESVCVIEVTTGKCYRDGESEPL